MASKYAHFVENELAKAKGSTTEMGGRVPLIVAGPSVAHPGTVCDDLVQCVDLFATVLDLFGAPGTARDSISFHGLLTASRPPVRDTVYTVYTVYTERRANPDRDPDSLDDRQAVRSDRYKLRWNHTTDAFEFHDLAGFRKERRAKGVVLVTRLCHGAVSSAADYDHCMNSLPVEARGEFERLWTYLATIRRLSPR